MAKYVPSPRDWVREQVELYENSGGTKGTTLRDTGLPVVLVTHWRVKDGDNYILIGSQGGHRRIKGVFRIAPVLLP